MIQRDLHPFALTTEADFTDEGVWLIKADFSFHTTAKGPMRGLLKRARLAVLAALTRQALWGWSLGAKTVQVSFKSGEHLTDFLLLKKTLAVNLGQCSFAHGRPRPRSAP
jgi:hypothetical protein